jgi:hypothetical protein
MQVPVDGRKQYSFIDMAVLHGVSGVSLDRFEQVSPTAYVVKGSWPPAARTPDSGFSGLAASPAEPEVPRSSPQARSIWPQLR